MFKKIPNYEDYEVSNCGIVRSIKFNKITELSQTKTKSGYYKVCLFKNGKRYWPNVHQLVAITFLGHKPNGKRIVVDHIDGNKLNNNVKNLRIISNRENVWANTETSSKYKGVSKRGNGSFRARIRINGKLKYLGTFKNELEAHEVYLRELSLV